MDSPKKKITRQAEPDAAGAERRRIGRIVHDDRGNASVEWQDAPTDHKRPVLEIEGETDPALSIQSDETFNPYERAAARERKSGNSTTRKDLRKLSEWIKMMRELEEKKRSDDTDD